MIQRPPRPSRPRPRPPRLRALGGKESSEAPSLGTKRGRCESESKLRGSGITTCCRLSVEEPAW